MTALVHLDLQCGRKCELDAQKLEQIVEVAHALDESEEEWDNRSVAVKVVSKQAGELASRQARTEIEIAQLLAPDAPYITRCLFALETSWHYVIGFDQMDDGDLFTAVTMFDHFLEVDFHRQYKVSAVKLVFL